MQPSDYKLAILAMEHSVNRVETANISTQVARDYPKKDSEFLGYARRDLMTARQAIETAIKLVSKED